MPMVLHMTLAEHVHKEYSNKLKKEHYTKRAEEECNHLPPEVNPVQWATLVAYWNKEKTKNKHGKDADPVTFFRECHTRKDKSSIHEMLERTTATMEGILQTLIESGQEDNEELKTRVYVDTMGPESHNKVRGYGHRVTLDMVSYASSSSSTSHSSRKLSKSAMALLMTQNNELIMREENTNKRISDLKGKIEQGNQLFTMFLQKF